MVVVMLLIAVATLANSAIATYSLSAPDSWVREAQLEDLYERAAPRSLGPETWTSNQPTDPSLWPGRRQYGNRPMRNLLRVGGKPQESAESYGPVRDLMYLLYDNQEPPRSMRRLKKEEESATFIKKTLLPYPRLG